MSNSISCAVILAGGQGKRMKSELPKPMFEVLGEPMLKWVMSACEKAGIDDMCVVTGYNSEVIENYLDGKCETVFQLQRKGTGHAVMMAEEWLKKHIGSNVIVLCGDAPFVDEKTISAALEQHTSQGNAVTVITAEIDNPTGYGRIIRTENGISAIVEEKDANAEQKAIREINSGAYWFDTEKLLEALEKLEPNNAQGEYYLTDTVEILLGAGYRADAYISPNPNVVMGANDRKGLLKLNDAARMAVIEKLMDDGVEFVCTDGVSIGRDVVIGAGTRILQGTILRGQTVIGSDCVIGPNTVVENCTVGDKTILNSVQAYESRIEDGVKIGPFVHIRPNSHIKSGVKIGDFVEVKNSTIGEKTSISHLTYVGDSDVGSGVNFGCGTVTSNYDGANKYRTVIGDGAFIGCNTNLIAPVKIGNCAYTAAGSTITEDVPDGALGIERGKQCIKEGFAERKLKKKK
ncbi:MAG: bifunctional UDP-N-acetylglucosamine diphosphorylase/glucosamine-1-phosphate N-acetyltransferase GlmU [Oscillospiraceae bacterium]|nr:bifunctional UDP-N-acetylglucosamine diphosphorylase/glucosamine-1-phosphate N-acetyltransferase GlmU [Oscillospiraceae bacterium]